MSRDKGSEDRPAGNGNEKPPELKKGKVPDPHIDRINRLREELRRKDSLLETSLELAAKLFSASGISTICRLICMSVSGRVGVEKVSVYRLKAESALLSLEHHLGAGREKLPDSLESTGRFLRWLNDREAPAHIDDYYRAEGKMEEMEAEWLEQIIRAGFSHVAALESEEELRGLIFLSGKISGEEFGENDRELIRIISSVGSAAAGTAGHGEASEPSPAIIEFSRFKQEELARRACQLDTPLTVLKSTLWSIETGMTGEGLMIDMARDAVRNLEKRINELNSISELKFGDSDLRIERADISGIIDDSLRKLIPEIEQKFASVNYDERILREVMVDPGKMEIAFTSIFEQLVEYLPPAGSIEIIASVSETGPGSAEGIELSGWRTGDNDGDGGEDALDRQLDDIAGGSWIRVDIISDTMEQAGGVIGRVHETDSAKEEMPPLKISHKIISDHGGKAFLKDVEKRKVRVSVWLPASF